MRWLTAIFVLVPLAVLGTTAAAQPQIDDLPPLPPRQPPQIDDLPPLPPMPRAAEKAVFDVIVEGQGAAYRRVDGEGSNGVCQISSGTVTNEAYEYGRGRGLRVVFTRLVRDPTEPGYWPAYYDRWPPFRLSQDDPVWDLTVDVPEGAHVIDEPTFSKWAGRSRGSSVTPRW